MDCAGQSLVDLCTQLLFLPSLLEFCLVISELRAQRAFHQPHPLFGRFCGRPTLGFLTRQSSREQPGPGLHSPSRVPQRTPGKCHKSIKEEEFRCFCWKKCSWGRSEGVWQDQCEAALGEEPSLGSKASMSRATSHGINWIILNFFLCLKTFPVKAIPWHGQGRESGAQQLPGGLAEVVLSCCP